MGTIKKSGVDYGGSGSGDVTKQYVDTQDAATLQNAKDYTDTAIAGIDVPTVVQATGYSETDVMSQKAVTDTLFVQDILAPGSYSSIQIGPGAVAAGAVNSVSGIAIGKNAKSDPSGYGGVAIGQSSRAHLGGVALGLNAQAEKGGIAIAGRTYMQNGISIGAGAQSVSNDDIAVGYDARTNGGNSIAVGAYTRSSNLSVSIGQLASSEAKSVALGAGSKATRVGEVNVSGVTGTGGPIGYNNTKYRVIGGVHDGVEQHDAATVAQGNKLMTGPPDSTSEGVPGQLWTDTSTMELWQCIAINKTDPQNPVYTWTRRW